MLNSNLATLEDLIKYSKNEREAVYIPIRMNPYLSSLTGIENELVYIPQEKNNDEDSVAEASKKDPPGMRLTPPGLSLANQVEDIV